MTLPRYGSDGGRGSSWSLCEIFGMRRIRVACGPSDARASPGSGLTLARARLASGSRVPSVPPTPDPGSRGVANVPVPAFLTGNYKLSCNQILLAALGNPRVLWKQLAVFWSRPPLLKRTGLSTPDKGKWKRTTWGGKR